MTTVFINAVSVREGGSLVVLVRLLEHMTALRPDWQWHVATNATAAPHLTGLRATLHPVHIRNWSLRFWYELVLPRLLRRIAADLLFSQTNYLPSRALCCPSVLLVQHAGHFSPTFNALQQQAEPGLLARLLWRSKSRWVHASVRHASLVLVQTQALAVALQQTCGLAARQLRVIPHGCGLIQPAAGPRAWMAFKPLRLGYISKVGVQKNFEVVLEALKVLRQSQVAVQLVLTLDPAHPSTQTLLQQAATLGVTDMIENLGELDAAGIAAAYSSLHAAVFASWCESFGFPLVEAMASGLPLVYADTPSNRELAGPAGLMFNGADATALATALEQLWQDAALYERQAALSLARAGEFSWERAAWLTLDAMDTARLSHA